MLNLLYGDCYVFLQFTNFFVVIGHKNLLSLYFRAMIWESLTGASRNSSLNIIVYFLPGAFKMDYITFGAAYIEKFLTSFKTGWSRRVDHALQIALVCLTCFC